MKRIKHEDANNSLWYCLKFRYYAEAALLVECNPEVDINRVVMERCTPLMLCCKIRYAGFHELRKVLLEHPDMDINEGVDMTPLMVACSPGGNRHLIPMLLDEPDIDLDIKDVEGRTASMMCFQRGIYFDVIPLLQREQWKETYANMDYKLAKDVMMGLDLLWDTKELNLRKFTECQNQLIDDIYHWFRAQQPAA
jgi:hypothetical protein